MNRRGLFKFLGVAPIASKLTFQQPPVPTQVAAPEQPITRSMIGPMPSIYEYEHDKNRWKVRVDDDG